MSRLIIKPFRFTPRLGRCTDEEKEARASGRKRRKRRDESLAEQMRFYVPLVAFQWLVESYSPGVCHNVFGVVVD